MKNVASDFIVVVMVSFIVFAAYGMLGDVDTSSWNIPFIGMVVKIALCIMVILGIIGTIILLFRMWYNRFEGYLFLDADGKFHRIKKVEINWGGSSKSLAHIYFRFNDKQSEWLRIGDSKEFFRNNKIMTEYYARKHYAHKLI